MNNPILKSASKMVFLLIAAASCIGLFTGNVSQDNFMILATSAFAFYFSNKGDGGTPITGSLAEPYLGK